MKNIDSGIPVSFADFRTVLNIITAVHIFFCRHPHDNRHAFGQHFLNGLDNPFTEQGRSWPYSSLR